MGIKAVEKIDFLGAIHKRDNKTIQIIYNQFLGKVIAFVIKNNGTKEDAKDIFDQAIFQISARLERDQFQIKSSFEAFLFTACKNLWRRELNKRAHRQVTNSNVKELYYKEKQMTQATLEQERWELFQEKVTELSENCSQVLQLFFKRFSSKDIMKNLGYQSENTVRQRIFKCKKQLMKLVQNDARFVELKNY